MRDLAELQNLVKRDKESYHQEFLLQFRHYLSELEIFKFNPAVHSSSFCDLVNFLSQVASCYPSDLSQFPQQLTDLLEQHSTVLHADTRISLVKSLILIRNRDLIPATTLLPLFFKLFRVHDKSLRNLLKSHIISDIKRMNQKKKNSKLNKTLQNFMRVMLKDTSEIAAKHSLDVMIELYRKKIWDDPHTVNVIAEGCFSKVTKILVGALQFFLSNNVDPEEAKASNDEDKELANQHLQKLLNSKSKKSRKKTTQLKKARDRVTKVRSRDAYLYVNFPAIQVLNDPQGLAEKIFGTLKHSNERFEVRIMMMNFISRMISVHKLLLINFYPWIKRYLQPSQPNVTHILAIVAQASHDIIDFDTMQPVIKAISDNFVSDRNSGAAITVGLNCVREICMRCPFALDEDSLLYFIQYKTFKDKGVRMAAKSLISLFRVINPKLLPKKERGKDSQSVIPRLYGQEKVADMVDGTDMLEEEYFGSEYLDENGNYQYLDENGEPIDFDKIEDEKEKNEDENGDEEEGEEEEEGEGEGEDEVEGEVDGDDNDDNIEIGEEIEDEDEEEVDDEEKDKRSESLNSKSSIASTSSTRSRSSRLDAIRLFTDEDFERIDALKIQREADKFSGKKRHRKEAPINTEDVSEQVDSANIESYIKKRKMNYDERMQSVMEGREGREKFGSKRANREATSTSNSVKNKGKPFQLTKYSREVREKNLRSAKEKMAIRRQHSLSSKSGKKK